MTATVLYAFLGTTIDARLTRLEKRVKRDFEVFKASKGQI
jgi:hypothetical protein